MATLTVQVSVAVLLLLASSYWSSAHKSFDEDEVYVSDEEEEAPTYYLGKAAFAPASSCSNLCQLCCTCFCALHSVTDLITYRRKLVYSVCVSCTKPRAPSPCRLFPKVLCMLPPISSLCLRSAQTMVRWCSSSCHHASATTPSTCSRVRRLGTACLSRNRRRRQPGIGRLHSTQRWVGWWEEEGNLV